MIKFFLPTQDVCLRTWAAASPAHSWLADTHSLPSVCLGFQHAACGILFSSRLSSGHLAFKYSQPVKVQLSALGHAVPVVSNSHKFNMLNCRQASAAALQRAEELKNEGNHAFFSRDLAKAVSYYSQALHLNPSSSMLHTNRSYLLPPPPLTPHSPPTPTLMFSKLCSISQLCAWATITCGKTLLSENPVWHDMWQDFTF